LRLLAVVIVGVLLSAAGSSAAPAVREVQVNPVLDMPFPANKQAEPGLAQNPLNPLNLISSSNDESGEPICTTGGPSSCPFSPGVSVSGFYASFDGGKTWPCHGLLDFSAAGFYAFGDPEQVFDTRGNAYYSTLALPLQADAQGERNADVFVARSADGGCTYPLSLKVSAGGGFHDKPAIAADGKKKSRFRDNVYVAWTWSPPQGADRILFVRSRDHGATWSAPVTISATGGSGGRTGTAVAVAPDGSVYVAWLDTTTSIASMRLAVSHDGGRTFPLRNVLVAPVTDQRVDSLPGTSFRQERNFPSLTIDQRGRLYTVWSTGTLAHGAVVVTSSKDGGKHWTTQHVAADVAGRSPFFSAVTVDPKGALDLVFVAADDVRNVAPGPGAVHYDAYFARSTNGGNSFSTPLLISSVPSDPDGSSTNSLTGQFVGDYISVVADRRGGTLYAALTDSRNAAACPAVDAYRAAPKTAVPDVLAQCPPTFGNTDIVLATVSY
jgi:hypothetical protein